MEDLFKQLDLAIYSSTVVHWWQHPLVQLLLVLVTCGSIFLIIWLGRKKKNFSQEPEVQRILATLYQSAVLWQQGTMDQRETLLVITVLLRKYTHVLVRNTAVMAMSDERWLNFVKSEACFAAVIFEAEQLVGLLARYKFSGAVLEPDQLKLSFELMYQIIAKTSSGSIATTSGLFAAGSSPCKT